MLLFSVFWKFNNGLVEEGCDLIRVRYDNKDKDRSHRILEKYLMFTMLLWDSALRWVFLEALGNRCFVIMPTKRRE
jgi:hypothetical protein